MARITQRQIAERTGLSQMTVSRALRNDPQVRKPTRDRVQQMAKALGFVPDPMLTALVTYKRSINLKNEAKRIAVIRSSPDKIDETKDWPAERQLIEGIRDRCGLYGFESLEATFSVAETDPQELRQSLLKDNASGLIWLCPQKGFGFSEPPFDLSGFYAVSVGWSFSETPINSVINDWHRAVQLALRQSIASGARRVGLFLSEAHNRRQWSGISEAYLANRGLHAGIEFIDPFNMDSILRDPRDVSEAVAWLETNRPDALLSGYGGRDVLKRVEAKTGFGFPQDYGFACIDVVDGINPDDSGTVWNRERTGQIAVNEIFNAIRSGQRGIPRTYQRILVEPKWKDGNSLGRRKAN